MKKHKVKKKIMMIYVLTALVLGGCGGEDFSEKAEIEMVEAEEIPAEETLKTDGEPKPEEEIVQNLPEETSKEETAENGREESGEKTAQEDRQEKGSGKETARLQKYQAVLMDILEKQIYPDGRECSFPDGVTPAEGSKFAVCDVDKDGKKELILCVTETYMAAMSEVVYDYDEKKDAVREELFGFPDMTFYENGLVEEGLSHNQGMAPLGDFWPYMLHRYQQEEDIYQCIFLVDAWEKEYRAEDYDGNPYPEDVDTDKSGIVYFTMINGEYDTAATEPIGSSAYEKWRKDQGLDSTKIEISWQALTEENIEDILGNN